MSLEQIIISHLRNLSDVSIDLHPKFNIFFGQNGSGKTSVLEAIHMLNMGRSFRSRYIRRIIQHEHDSTTLFSRLTHKDTTIKVGTERDKQGNIRIKINDETAQSPIEITKLFPLLLICPDSHGLLSAGPKFRRQFIDWGLFHVEQTFYPQWQTVQRAIKQRNAALKQYRYESEHVVLWNTELIRSAYILNDLRKRHVAELAPLFSEHLSRFLPDLEITLSYYPGWNEDDGLETVLNHSLSRDVDLGYTQYGPHRADLKIRINNVPVHEFLSQGQQKLTIYAMRLAQGQLLKNSTNRSSIFLVDDLPAELDIRKRAIVVDALSELEAQVFITGAEQSELKHIEEHYDCYSFHVEQGKINRTKTESRTLSQPSQFTEQSA